MLLPLLMNLGMLGSNQTIYSGGYGHAGRLPSPRRRDPEELRQQREELGILPKRVIEEVAQRQVESLEQDAQKQFEELSRELALKSIEWDAIYLTALAEERERLIGLEISKRLTKQRNNRNTLTMLLIAAA